MKSLTMLGVVLGALAAVLAALAVAAVEGTGRVVLVVAAVLLLAVGGACVGLGSARAHRGDDG